MNTRSERPSRESAEPRESFSYEILSNPETRRRLRERMVRLTDQIHGRGVGAVVFLDRSSRPLSWMFSDLWAARFPEEKRPEIRFLNVGDASFEHRGTTRWLVGEPSSLPWYLQEDLTRRIRALDLETEWLGIDDVPEEWNDRVLAHVDELESLGPVFGNSFDSKNVLVVDEIVASGQSLLAAVAALSAVFPTANFRATAAFKTLYRGKEADRELIPWLSVPGMAGILESVDSDFLSERVTEAGVERLRTVLRGKIKDELRVGLRHAGRFPGARDRFILALERIPGTDPGTIQWLRDELGWIGTEVDRLAREGIYEGFSSGEFKRRYRAWSDCARDVKNGLSSEDARAFGRHMTEIDEAIPTNYFEFDNAVVMAERLGQNGYGSVKTMLGRARRLREELRRLAAGP